ncbi:sigma-70 family RNA polymerase sigma factor [bacterium]|nr:sigma-70 family RNA polymerase sigma factor [bacterium]
MRPTAVLRLVRAAAPAPLADAADAELLRRFCRDRDEAAFRELLRRYEALVRGASGRLTRDRHAVDDAVQATFLTLARKAHTIRHPEALASWLYRVARSVTPRAAGTAPLATDTADPAPSTLDRLTAREAMGAFEEELDRLPAAHRAAVLLCTVEGNTVEDAARRLGTTPGAVRGWLQRGRDRLRRRLGERGVELSVALSLLAVAPAGTASAGRDALVQAVLAAHRPAPARLLTGPLAVWGAVVVLSAGVVSALGRPAPGAGPQPTPPPADVRVGTKADPPVTRDNLPDGAVARIGSPRLRHAGEVVAVAFSRDGRWLATVSPASPDKSVRVWDLADGTERYRIPITVNPHEHTAQYRTAAVAFAAGDTRLLVMDAHEFRAFEAATGRRERSTVVSKPTDPNQFFPPEGVIGTGLSPDGKTFAAVRRNGEMVLGDAATGAVRRTVRALNLPANTSYSFVDVIFTPDGSEVCVPVRADAIPVFDTATGESRRTLAKGLVPERGVTNNVAFVTNGRQLITVGATAGPRPGPAVVVGDAETGKALRTIPLPAGPRVLGVSPNGKLLAVGTDSFTSSEVRVLDLESGKEVGTIPATGTPTLVTFSPDSRLLATAGYQEGRVTVWDLEKNARHPQSADETSPLARFDRDGRVVMDGGGRTVTVDWRTGTTREEKTAAPRLRWGTAVSADGKLRAEAVAPKDQPGRALDVVVTEAATKRVVGRLGGVSDFPRGMAFADRARLLVTAAQDNVLAVWDIAAGKQLWSEAYPARAFGYMGMGDPVFDAAGRRMAVCTMAERTTVIDVWELRQRVRVTRVEVPETLLTAGVAFSPDGEFVAGGADAVTVWRVADGRAVHTLRGHAAPESPNDRAEIRCAYSADGGKLLTIDLAGTIRVWEAATGGVIRTFTGHHGRTGAAFSADARTVVGASSDAPVFVWDVYGLGARPPFDAGRLWAALADPSPETAFRAVRELCASPREATTLLREKLAPESIDPGAVAGWIKDLSAPQFAARERATAELEKRGESVAPLLREALRAAPDAESRRRLAPLVGRTERPSADGLRVRRALDALEHLGTPEAEAHLSALGRGTPGCLQTVLAREALARLSGR